MMIDQNFLNYDDLETLDKLNYKYVPITYDVLYNQQDSHYIIGENSLYHYKIDFPNKERNIKYVYSYENIKIVNNSNILFIGDSRFVGMKETHKNDYKFFCEIGKGYNWLISNEEKIKELVNEDTIVVISLGINDLYNLSNYEDYFKNNDIQNIYFVSINPVDEIKEREYNYNIKNQDIDEFNTTMEKIFKNRFIDTNTFLKENGFETKDGIHYNSNTYKKIYSYITFFLADKTI